MQRQLLSGNEAIAWGAFAAGVQMASAYPGTPSTEILENMAPFEEIDSSWAPNEKVALEAAMGASFGGVRALATMKHVGVNVAADPLFTLSYTGVRGGLVLVSADDPELHSSQNEQDNRHYARAAKIPMLEPADSQEALDMTIAAFDISERFDTPVLLRITTRIAHSKSVVSCIPQRPEVTDGSLKRDAAKFVMLPGNARLRHAEVEKRQQQLAHWAAQQPFNRIEDGDSSWGIITSGVAYQHAREVFPEAKLLKLGFTYPLPKELVQRFAASVAELYIIEELDPFLEEQLKALGFTPHGKDRISQCGELTAGRLRQALVPEPREQGQPEAEAASELPPRPPAMCPGCPHRGVFYALKKQKAYVTGDIGCYTLGFMPPLNAMDTCICMGASISNASGLARTLSADQQQQVVAVIGDSTFLHTGINSLMDMVYNRVPATVVILDNGTTAMTGRQEHPGTGRTLKDQPAPQVDLETMCRSLGIGAVRTVDPWDLEATQQALAEEMARSEVSVVITRGPCVLIKRDLGPPKPPLQVDAERCTGCRACLRIGCPALSWEPQAGQKGQVKVHELLCNGCGICAQLCRFDALKPREQD